ncbi:MAG TPA: nicotinamidase [Gammaproteobacteria bacterium]|jgi:nicotinamidase/pyrazinamidase|nr:nicotinamidase [Gammaproteobacteria bacterium]
MPRPDSAALLIVDLQYDFLPGGALAVPQGDAIVAPIAALLRDGPFGTRVATQDWHPPHHASFASGHAGHRPFDVVTLHGRDQVLWPDHCVAGSRGAELTAGVPWERVHAIVRKGTDPAVDSYSGFRNNLDARGQRPPTGLAGYLRERGVGTVTICGLARDYCVRWTAEDAAALGFTAVVLWDLTRPVAPESDAAVRAALAAAGVRVIDSAELG